jgi:hypothetical protein
MSKEDDYQSNILNKYLDSLDYDVSNCCGATVDDLRGICNKCYEHCDTISIGDYNYNQYESAMEDKADEKRERMRDE